MNNPNFKKFYQNSPKPVNYLPNVRIDGVPQYAPTMSGLMLINPTTKNIWVSAGKEQVSDWISIVGGSGSSILLQTNNVTNPTQSILNLYSGDGTVSLIDDGLGNVNLTIPAPTKPTKQVTLLFTDTNVTISAAHTNVPNFQLDVLTGYTYSFRIVIPFDIDNPGFGTAWALSSADPAPVYLGYSSYSPAGTNNLFIYNNSITTYNGATNAAAQTVSATGNIAVIEGLFTPSEDGPLRISVVNEGQGGSGTITVKAGAYIEYYQIAV